VKICPRCGFDIDGFRNLDGSLPVTKPRAPAAPTAAAPEPKTVALAIGAVVLVVAGAVAWWAFSRPRPVVQPVVATPTGDKGYVSLQTPQSAPADPPVAAEEPAVKEPRGDQGTARPTAAPGGPVLGRGAVDTGAPVPTPAFYRVILTDGTVYDAVSPPGDGAMITLQLVNGTRAVVYRSDIDVGKTRLANEPPAPEP